MKFTINSNALKAASIAAASKDIRYYLVGVNVDFRAIKPDAVTVVGTDGHMMFMAETPIQWQDNQQIADFNIIIPLNTIKAACKAKSESISLESLPDGRYMLNGVRFAAIDSKYPDYERVIPDSVTGEQSYFNPDLLYRGQSALRIWSNTKSAVIPVLQNGNFAGVMQHGSATVVIIGMHKSSVNSEYIKPLFPVRTVNIKIAA